MKGLIAFILFINSTFCLADCYSNFSQGRDSTFYQVNVGDINSNSTATQAKHALKKLFNKFDCEFKLSTFKCDRIAVKQSESYVCYARSDFGYFIINKDYLENINVIFNRFD